MLVLIKNCHPANYKKDLDKQESIQNILNAHGQRKHIVVSPSYVCKEIIDSKIYGYRYELYASDLLEHKNEIGSLKDKFHLSITFDFSHEDESNPIITTNGNKRNITCSYKLANLPSFYESPLLIGEDDSDCLFYDLISNCYAKKNFGLIIKSKTQFIDGGGSKTHEKYKTMMKNSTFGICIVDNDKKHPDAGEGRTSLAFSRTKNERGFHKNQQSLILDFHEAECIIPDQILEKVIDNSKIDDFDLVKKFNKTSNYQFRRFFDHKNGLNLNDAWTLDKKRNNKFWEPFFKQINTFTNKPCQKVKSCVNTKEEIQCPSCIKINGFGHNILEQSITLMEKSNLISIKANLSPYLEEQWDTIGSAVLNWGCCIDLPKPRS